MGEKQVEGHTTRDAVAQARELYLDEAHAFGCAETSFVVLKTAYGLPLASDPSAAMALNGGLAYSGGPCGALTGAALAVGMLAEQRIGDHHRAKRVARELVAQTLDAFQAAHGATDCRELIGVDLRTTDGHRAFLESGAWRDGCMRQIEFVIGRLSTLADVDEWEEAVARVEGRDAG